MSEQRLTSRGDSEPSGGERSVSGPIGGRLWGRFPRVWRRINRLAFLAMNVFFLSVLMSIVAPQRYRIGPVSVSFEGVLKSVLEWIAAYVVWHRTYDGFGAWLKHWTAPLDRQFAKVGAQIRRCCAAAARRMAAVELASAAGAGGGRRSGFVERLVLGAVSAGAGGN